MASRQTTQHKQLIAQVLGCVVTPAASWTPSLSFNIDERGYNDANRVLDKVPGL